jgi:tetratricopeptide (TPR) repeat protein
MLGDFPGATALCQEVTKTGGHHDWRSFAHTTLGIMWASSGNWQEALQQFFNATQALPSNAEAWLRRAQGLATIQDRDEARAALEKTVEVAPVSQWARIAIERLEGDPEGWVEMNLPMPEVPQAYAAPEQPAYGYPPTQPMPYGPPPVPQPPETPLGSPVRRPQEPPPPPQNEGN